MGKKATAKLKKHTRAANGAFSRPTEQAVPEAPEPALVAGTATPPAQIASQLNSMAIHLLRRLHREDAALGLSGARLSALSVLVFGGPRTIGKLADAEGVTPPSMTRLVAAMEAEGLVQRAPSPTDARSVIIRATAEGEGIMLRGREQRVLALAGWLSSLEPSELAVLEHAAELLERVLGERAAERRRSS